MQKKFTARALPSTRHMNKIIFFWGGGGGGGSVTIQTESDGSLRVYFVVQIPPCTVVAHTGKEYVLAMAEMTQSLQADLVLSDMWAITCSIGVQSSCVQQRSGVAKMHTAPEKCNVYTTLCNEHDPCSLFPSLHHRLLPLYILPLCITAWPGIQIF